jgi:hypothetical protein
MSLVIPVLREIHLLLTEHGNSIYGPFIVDTLFNPFIQKSNGFPSMVVEMAGQLVALVLQVGSVGGSRGDEHMKESFIPHRQRVPFESWADVCNRSRRDNSHICPSASCARRVSVAAQIKLTMVY